jgi:serine/arginine repetitive matrix protein 1
LKAILLTTQSQFTASSVFYLLFTTTQTMPAIKGTASISSTHALSKLLRSTTFPPSFSTKVDTTKLHRGVLSHWIEQRITELLGFEDEIVSEMATNLFLPENNEEVDPRKAQLDLVGFLGEKEAAEFASELWEMMLDGSQRKSGIPLILVEKKKEEMKKARSEGVSHGQGYGGRRVAGGPQGGEMNAFVREANRRAEMARAALNHNNVPEVVKDAPPSPRQSRELYTIDRTGMDRDDNRNKEGRGLDEFGRHLGDRDSNKMSRRKRSPSPSPSPSSRSSGSYSSSSYPKRKESRGDRRRDSSRRKRSRSRSNSSEDVRRRRRDGKNRR